MTRAPDTPPGPRLVDAMPRPLLIVFALAALVGLGVSLVFIIRPPSFETVALQDRRPPPRAPFAHDPARVFPAPLPDVEIPFEPPCEEMRATTVLGGTSFVARITEALDRICALRGGSVDPIVGRAVRGFDGATIRIAQFERSGIESTSDLSARTIWLNLKLVRRDIPVRDAIPVLVHEAWHLAHAGETVTAEQELNARKAEHEVCRLIISSPDWPRWCQDARALVSMPEAEALSMLAAAGFERGVSSEL